MGHLKVKITARVATVWCSINKLQPKNNTFLNFFNLNWNHGFVKWTKFHFTFKNIPNCFIFFFLFFPFYFFLVISLWVLVFGLVCTLWVSKKFPNQENRSDPHFVLWYSTIIYKIFETNSSFHVKQPTSRKV